MFVRKGTVLMKEFINCVKEQVKEIELKDLAFIKICTLALGILLGMAAPKKLKKPIFIIIILVYIVTMIPILVKIFHGKEYCTCKKCS